MGYSPSYSKENLRITHTESLFTGLTFRSDSLDSSLSRDLSDFTASPPNGVRDLNCRLFFILLSSLPLFIGTFVIESTAVLCCTEPGTVFENTLTSEHFAITLLQTKCVSLISPRSKD